MHAMPTSTPQSLPRRIVERGRTIGRFNDSDIPEYIVTSDGLRWEFDSVVANQVGKNFFETCKDKLTSNFCFIYPGIVFERAQPEPACSLP